MSIDRVSQYEIRMRTKKFFDLLLFLQNRKIQKFLNDLAEKYNAPACKVLEIGAGTEALAHKKLFGRAFFTATDIRKYEGVDYILDLTSPRGLKSDFFDLIICMNVLEQIAHPDKVLNEVHRALKMGGELFLVTPFLFPIHDPPHDFYRYTEYALVEMLNKFSGVSIEKIHLMMMKLGFFDRLVLNYVARAVK